jgi:hypothetical protein
VPSRDEQVRALRNRFIASVARSDDAGEVRLLRWPAAVKVAATWPRKPPPRTDDGTSVRGGVASVRGGVASLPGGKVVWIPGLFGIAVVGTALGWAAGSSDAWALPAVGTALAVVVVMLAGAAWTGYLRDPRYRPARFAEVGGDGEALRVRFGSRWLVLEGWGYFGHKHSGSRRAAVIAQRALAFADDTELAVYVSVRRSAPKVRQLYLDAGFVDAGPGQWLPASIALFRCSRSRVDVLVRDAARGESRR